MTHVGGGSSTIARSSGAMRLETKKALDDAICATAWELDPLGLAVRAFVADVPE